MNSVRLSNLSLDNQKFNSLGCKDIKNRKFEFVAKTQFFQIFIEFKSFKWLINHKNYQIMLNKKIVEIFSIRFLNSLYQMVLLLKRF